MTTKELLDFDLNALEQTIYIFEKLDFVGSTIQLKERKMSKTVAVTSLLNVMLNASDVYPSEQITFVVKLNNLIQAVNTEIEYRVLELTK